MFYLFVYDDDQQDCILYGVSNKNDFVDIKRNLQNQGVGYEVIEGKSVEKVDGVVFGDGDDIWEPVDDDGFLDEQFDDEKYDADTYNEEDDWDNRYSPEPDYNDSFYDEKVDEDRPY